MRGSPPLHLALLLLFFAGLAVPLIRLTSSPARALHTPHSRQHDAAQTPVRMRLRYAHKPDSLKITCAGQTLSPDAATELDLPPEGIELSAEVRWPIGTPDTALTIELEPDGLDTLSQTRWSLGAEMHEIIPFVWKR